MKITSLLLLSVFSASAFAATSSTTTSTTSSASWYDTLKESPFKASVLTSNVTKKDGEANIVGVKSANYLYTGYKLSSKGKIDLENKVVWDSGDSNSDTPASTTWERAALSYNHSILTQDKQGVNLKAGLEYRLYPETTVQEAINYTSHARASVALSKSFSNGIDLVGTAYYIDKFNVDSARADTTTALWELVTTQTYNISDKLNVYMYQDTVALNKNNVTSGSEVPIMMDLNLGVGYVFNKMVSGDIEVGNTMLTSNDGQVITENFLDQVAFAAELYISLF